MHNQNKAYTLALIAIGFWSTIGSAFKITLRHIDFMHLLLFASLTAAIVQGAYLLFTNKFKILFQLKFKDYLSPVFASVLNPFLYYLVLLRAYDILPAQEAGTLNYFWPVTLVLFSMLFLKQKVRLKSLSALGISFFGIVWISSHGNPLSLQFGNSLGVLLALSSTIVWSLFWIINMKNPMDDSIKLFISFISGFILIFISILLFETPVWPTYYGFLGAVYIGIFEMGITFLIWLRALKYTENTATISNLVFLSPFISLIFIHFVVGEEILYSTFAGLILVVAGILLQKYFSSAQKRQKLSNLSSK